MSEEEKKVIEELENLSEYGLCYTITSDIQEDIKIALNLIQKKDEIIGKMIDNIMIHYQVKTIRKMCCPTCKIGERACTHSGIHRNCIKQYFEKKVEGK